MARIVPDRIKRGLNEAEGFLMLGLPAKALEVLQSRADWATMKFEANFLTGEALRSLGRCREAIAPLESAAALRPEEIGVALALGWCYKRTHKLAQAIDSLERARRHNPDEPLLRYNLACYWSLVGQADKALAELSAALELQPDLRRRIADEADFNSLRGLADFERLTADHASQA